MTKPKMTRDEYLTTGHYQCHKSGTDLPHAKLTEEIVREVRINRHGLTAKQWANQLGVHQRTIDKVRDYRSWRHV